MSFKFFNDLLRIACAALAAWFAIAFIFVALMTLNYPFHIEWMEGQSIDVIARVRGGLPVYAAPSIDYVPFIYTPLYYYVAAFVSFFTGVDFLPARLVSLCATLGSGAVLFSWIRREGGSRATALIAAGLFFATYRLSGRWFDNARVDSLALFFTLAGAYALFHKRGWKNAILAALLFAAAFFTKQSSLSMIAAAGFAALMLDWKHALRAGAVLAALLISGVGIAHFITDGWFDFYVFTVPMGHSLSFAHYGRHFLKGELLRQCAAMLSLCLAGIVCFAFEDRRKAAAYGVLLAGVILSTFLMRIHTYSFLNVLMPMHAALALGAGLGLLCLERFGDRRLACAGLALLIIQQGAFYYSPLKLLPRQEAVDKGNLFLSRLSQIEGDVFMPDLQFVQTRVGKKSYDLGMAAFDLFRSNLGAQNQIKQDLQRQIADAVAQQRFAAVSPGIFFPLPEKKGLYRFAYSLPYPGEYVTGAVNLVRPDIYLKVPK